MLLREIRLSVKFVAEHSQKLERLGTIHSMFFFMSFESFYKPGRHFMDGEMEGNIVGIDAYSREDPIFEETPLKDKL